MLTYIMWLAVFAWLPIAILYIMYPRLIWRYRKSLLFCTFWTFVFSMPWDYWAISMNIWFFPKSGVIGIYLLNIPVEEFMFFVSAMLIIAILALVLREKLGKALADKRFRG